MKLPCPVVRDLLPLYAEQMVTPETLSLVEDHLRDCADCQEKLSEITADTVMSVDSTKPLQVLKKEIRKRRVFTAMIAALFVFVAVYTYFYHTNELQLVPWHDGLIEVEGIEARPYEEVFSDNDSQEAHHAKVDVLVLKTDSRLNGYQESLVEDEDGSSTLILQGWSSNFFARSMNKEQNELVLSPIPDRVIYSNGKKQELLWGKPLNGGVEVLPRLALAFYIGMAIALSVVLGALWFIFRKRDQSWICRQLFFAPVSYTLAHFLIKGDHTTSFFMERDFISIVLIAIALYALLSLTWQIWLHRKKAV